MMESNIIVNEIKRGVQNVAKTVPQDYFVGITSNPDKRMFEEHNLDEISSKYAYFMAQSKIEAKKALAALLSLNMNGFPVSDKIPGKYVYCYKIEGKSKECDSDFE